MSGANENKRSLTVKIQIPENSENILAVNFPNTFNIGDLKEDIAKKFKISGDQLAVYQNDNEIHDKHMLCHLNLNDFGIIEIKLKLTDDAINDGIILDTSVYYSSFTLPDIITVHVPVENEDGETTTRDLVVEIENKSIKKPFLGGYVHNKTSEVKLMSSGLLKLIFYLSRDRVSSRIYPNRPSDGTDSKNKGEYSLSGNADGGTASSCNC